MLEDAGLTLAETAPIRDGVDGVGGGPSKPQLARHLLPIELPVDAGERPRAERQRHRRSSREVEADRVALEHPEVGEEVVAEVDGLRALQVRVAGHRPVRVALAERQQPAH